MEIGDSWQKVSMQNEFGGPGKAFNREVKGKFMCIRLQIPNMLTIFSELQDSWQHLLRDRATRSLTYNDEQFHALEKIKVRLQVTSIQVHHRKPNNSSSLFLRLLRLVNA